MSDWGGQGRWMCGLLPTARGPHRVRPEYAIDKGYLVGVLSTPLHSISVQETTQGMWEAPQCSESGGPLQWACRLIGRRTPVRMH